MGKLSTYQAAIESPQPNTTSWRRCLLSSVHWRRETELCLLASTSAGYVEAHTIILHISCQKRVFLLKTWRELDCYFFFFRASVKRCGAFCKVASQFSPQHFVLTITETAGMHMLTSICWGLAVREETREYRTDKWLSRFTSSKGSIPVQKSEEWRNENVAKMPGIPICEDRFGWSEWP